jgi:general secretion pathway protein B
MSLILDALKKSEQERRRERGPDLQTIHQATSVAARVQGRRWSWVLLLVALNVAAFGGWWWYQQRLPVAAINVAAINKTAANADVPVQSMPEVAAPTPVANSSAESAAMSAINAREEPQFTRIEPRPAAAQPRVEADAPIEEFTELAPDVRSALPAMTFSFHVFSTDPLNRTIIINNQRLREGSEVSAGVVLQAITEDGVILTMDHHRIHINVLTGW